MSRARARIGFLAELARMKGISRRGKKTRFHKKYRRRMKGISRRGNSIPFGRYIDGRYIDPFGRYTSRFSLEALEPARIPVRQIEAGRRAIKRCLRPWAKAKIWVLPDPTPAAIRTMKPRMGSGKGDPKYWVIKPGQRLYEISFPTVSYNNTFIIAKRILALAAYRMPIHTQFVSTEYPF